MFDQQADDYTEAALTALVGTFAVAPRWWNFEVLNVLLALERRKRLVTGKAVDLLRHMQRLPVRLQNSQASVFELQALSIRRQLSSYVALYLEVALRWLPACRWQHRTKCCGRRLPRAVLVFGSAERSDRMCPFTGGCGL